MNKTLDFYNRNVETYFAVTVDANMSETRSRVLKYIPYQGQILDLGCGSGRDSKDFREKNYIVKPVDGSSEMAERATEYLQQFVLCQTFEKLKFPPEIFDLIWACASLLHMPFNDLPAFLERSSKWLKPDGYYYMSFKYGDFEGERDGRYYTDLNPNRLNQLLKKVKTLRKFDIWTSNDVRTDIGTKWFNVILKK